MMRDAIVARDLTCHYGDLTAVDALSFRVAEVDGRGFLGPNGAGKTTTIRMLTGQRRPKGGHATLLGLVVVRHPKQVQAQIGVCFECTNLYEQMTVLQNLTLFAQLFGVLGFDARALPQREA
jgi:ABC-2 type transport system ATP-binding protein